LHAHNVHSRNESVSAQTVSNTASITPKRALTAFLSPSPEFPNAVGVQVAEPLTNLTRNTSPKFHLRQQIFPFYPFAWFNPSAKIRGSTPFYAARTASEIVRAIQHSQSHLSKWGDFRGAFLNRPLGLTRTPRSRADVRSHALAARLARPKRARKGEWRSLGLGSAFSGRRGGMIWMVMGWESTVPQDNRSDTILLRKVVQVAFDAADVCFVVVVWLASKGVANE
jgi:hypothetical protein